MGNPSSLTVVAAAYEASAWVGMIAGFVAVVIGVIPITFERGLTLWWNRFYARLPGGWQYPPWWSRALGIAFVAFGLLVVVLCAWATFE
jgi:hypothetical protein